MENETFEAIHLICPNQHPSLLKFLFIEDSLKITKGLELVSRPQFSQNFLIKGFVLHCYITWPNFISFHYFPSYSVKCTLCFMLRHLMTSWYLNIWKFKIWISQELKELWKGNKEHFSLFHKCSLLDILTKLAKM